MKYKMVTLIKAAAILLLGMAVTALISAMMLIGLSINYLKNALKSLISKLYDLCCFFSGLARRVAKNVLIKLGAQDRMVRRYIASLEHIREKGFSVLSVRPHERIQNRWLNEKHDNHHHAVLVEYIGVLKEHAQTDIQRKFSTDVLIGFLNHYAHIVRQAARSAILGLGGRSQLINASAAFLEYNGDPDLQKEYLDLIGCCAAEGDSNAQRMIDAVVDRYMENVLCADSDHVLFAARGLVALSAHAIRKIRESPHKFAVANAVFRHTYGFENSTDNFFVVVTDPHRCPFRFCEHCFMSNIEGPDFPLQQLKVFFEALSGCRLISLIGGEPFAYMKDKNDKSKMPSDGFYAMLRSACENFDRVVLDTNGYYLSERYDEFVKLMATLSFIENEARSKKTGRKTEIVIRLSIDEYHEARADRLSIATNLLQVYQNLEKYERENRDHNITAQYNIMILKNNTEDQIAEAERIGLKFGFPKDWGNVDIYNGKYIIEHDAFLTGEAERLADKIPPRRTALYQGGSRPLFVGPDGTACDDPIVFSSKLRPADKVLGNVNDESGVQEVFKAAKRNFLNRRQSDYQERNRSRADWYRHLSEWTWDTPKYKKLGPEWIGEDVFDQIMGGALQDIQGSMESTSPKIHLDLDVMFWHHFNS